MLQIFEQDRALLPFEKDINLRMDNYRRMRYALVQDGHIVWHLIVLHYIVPIMTLLDWLLFDKKGEMPVWGPLTWESLALGYLAFSMIAVGVFGIYMGGGTTADVTNYPYTFLDPGIVGGGGVAGFCAGMIVLFVVLGYLLYGTDHLMARRANAKGQRIGRYSRLA